MLNERPCYDVPPQMAWSNLLYFAYLSWILLKICLREIYKLCAHLHALSVQVSIMSKIIFLRIYLNNVFIKNNIIN